MYDVFSRLSEAYPNLRKAEKRIADLILADVDLVLRVSIAELGEAASVSASSITRFSRSLGFEGFRDLKIAIAQAQSAQSPYYHQSVQNLGQVDLVDGQLEYLYLQQIISALSSTFSRLKAEALTDAINAIRGANRVKLFGVAVSGLIAQEAAIRFARLGLDTEFISDSHFQKIAASLLGEQDVAICLSHTGRSKETLDAAEIARSQGAHVICLTAPHTPLSQKADILLEVSVFEEIDIYTPSISQYPYHYIIGLMAFHIGQSADLDREGLLEKIKCGLAQGLISEDSEQENLFLKNSKAKT